MIELFKSDSLISLIELIKFCLVRCLKKLPQHQIPDKLDGADQEACCCASWGKDHIHNAAVASPAHEVVLAA